MRKIKEVLRLKFEVGLGLRQIARSCSIGLGTAHEYLERAEAAKITWPLRCRSAAMIQRSANCTPDSVDSALPGFHSSIGRERCYHLPPQAEAQC